MPNQFFRKRSPRFQFHKGTIKTALSVCDSELLKNFNSIKVRLKQGTIYVRVNC